MTEFVALFLKVAGDPRKIVADPAASNFGVVLDDLSLVPEGGTRLAPTYFDKFLSRGEFRL